MPNVQVIKILIYKEKKSVYRYCINKQNSTYKCKNLWKSVVQNKVEIQSEVLQTIVNKQHTLSGLVSKISYFPFPKLSTFQQLRKSCSKSKENFSVRDDTFRLVFRPNTFPSRNEDPPPPPQKEGQHYHSSRRIKKMQLLKSYI